MKKLLLSLGSIATIVAPVTAVVACGDEKKTDTFDMNAEMGKKYASGDKETIKGMYEFLENHAGQEVIIKMENE